MISLVLVLVSAACVPAWAQTAPAARAPFTVIVLPDTQIYAAAYPKHFIAQTRWIRENRQKLNIVFVAHVGDITNAATEREWKVADEAFKLLDGVVPVGLSVGNHDFDKLSVRKRNTVGFNRYFGVKRYEKHAWYAGHMGNDNDNSFQRFEAGGMKFLVINLEFGPPDDVIAWANEVVAKHPDRRVLVNTHCYMYTDDTRVGPEDRYNPHRYDAKANDGEDLWKKFVSKHPNIHFVVSGHILGDGLGRLTSEGEKGNKVHQVLVNYQMRRQGGQGYLRVMRFDPRLNKVTCRSYSPVLDRYKTDVQNEYTVDYDMNVPVAGQPKP